MDDKRLHILKSAFTAGNRYGFKRTTMEDIAVEAGISRPTLYLYFANKDEIVQSCVKLSIDQAFAEAQHAAKASKGDFVNQLIDYLNAYLGYFHRLLVSSPHADELSEVSKALDKEQIAEIKLRQVRQLNSIAKLPDNDEFGLILVQASEGIKYGAENETQLAQRLERLVRALAAQL